MMGLADSLSKFRINDLWYGPLSGYAWAVGERE